MKAYNKDNIFAKIIKDEIPSIKILDEENYLVIMDAFPEKLGHVLIIPKNESRNIFDIETKDLERMMSLAQKIAIAQRKAFGSSGAKIVQNSESSAGQVVFHTHLHLIPYFNDTDDMPSSLDTMEKQAEALKKALME